VRFNDIKEFKQFLKDLVVEIRQEKKDHGYSERKHRLSWKYRHYHIAYCLLRGREYVEIEQIVQEGNEPNMLFVRNIMDSFHNETLIRDSA